MDKYIFPALIIILLIASSCSIPQENIETQPLQNGTPVEYYAVLAEKDGYADVDMTPLMVDYIDIKRLRNALEELGWPAENIRDLKEFDQEEVKEIDTGKRKTQSKKQNEIGYIRVDVEKLNLLMDLVGEIVISESMVSQHPILDQPGHRRR